MRLKFIFLTSNHTNLSSSDVVGFIDLLDPVETDRPVSKKRFSTKF